MITLQHISKRFGRKTALHDNTYTVAPGSVFALLGENGAGKTTTIRILLGLCEPDDGTATVLGLDPMRNDYEIRRRIGYVPEQPALYDWMTVSEIGRFTASFYANCFWNEYLRQAERFNLPLGSKIKTLSKGQRAKVSLSLALSHDPELLILDEPTSGLDAMVRREFLESMVDRAATGKTVFLSSHQIAEVERVADTVAILKQSELRLVEKLDDLKATAHLLTVTLKSDGDFSCPLETVVQRQTEGRNVKVFGRNLDPAARNILQQDGNVAQFEIRQPTLEEIFLGYMS